MKYSRPQYGLEEEIVEAIYALRDKKSSQIFKEPVDPAKVPDYYDKIKKPMDLTTIVKKLKMKQYAFSEEVHQDLQLIVENCKFYNTFNPTIIKKAEQFQDCIKTVWGNFKKEIDKKGISYNRPIEVNEEILKKINLLEDKKNKRRLPNLHQTIEQEKKNILQPSTVLPPLQLDFNKNQKEELPPQLQLKNDSFSLPNRDDRKRYISFYFNEENLAKQFEQTADKKLKKYKRILKKRLLWFDKKIIDKCLKKKRFQKMFVPNHLKMFLDNGSIAEDLSIRKLQLYVKQITYWVEANSNILNDYMKDRFVENCKLTKKCILRVIKYRKIPKIRAMNSKQLYDRAIRPEYLENEREDDNYDNKMKEFRRNLDRDQGDSTKRDTKIILKNQNGELQVIDWTSDKKQERVRKEGGGTTRVEIMDTDEKRKLEEKRKEELQKDREFIEEYRKKSNFLIVGKYGSKLRINWDIVTYQDIELPKELSFNYSYTDDDN